MLVPEAAMHEYSSAMFRQDDVGLAREIGSMQSKAIAHYMEQMSYRELGLCVLAADTAHVPAALFA